MKKALFYGSSFTWGTGLFLWDNDGYHKKYYSEKDWDWSNIIIPEDDIVDSQTKNIKIKDSGRERKKFMYENRWTKLVSNHFNLKEFNSGYTGGLISHSLVQMKNQMSRGYETMDNEKFNWEDIGLLSIEFYGIGGFDGFFKNISDDIVDIPRTPIDIEKFIKENNTHDDHLTQILIDWVMNFDYDFELKTQLNRLNEQLKVISEFNIPTVIHVWGKDDVIQIKDIIQDYPYVNRSIMNREESILEWTNDRYQLHDEHPYWNKGIGRTDFHTGLNGHKIFSKRIINFIENA